MADVFLLFFSCKDGGNFSERGNGESKDERTSVDKVVDNHLFIKLSSLLTLIFKSSITEGAEESQ